jgi:cAMP-dependent protein kinase regulator
MEISTIVDACEEKKYKKNEYVIKQGDNGDNLYIIESGELICEKVFKEGESPTYLKTYKEGELFGELALLYNAPRAATIYAKTDCVLWALDRLTFNSIIKESSINKREKYKRFLETIPLLSTVESYELYSICDAIKVEKFEKNQYIIKEGEEGDKFYILDEGEAVATKEKMSFKKQYLKGDYFGELALLRNAPRAASVMAVTNCKVLSLDRDAFKRLLGPLKDILKRNSEAYEKYANE